MQVGVSFVAMLYGTINLVYQVQMAHLNPLQLVLVGTVLEASAFLFEIPTGVVADIYSRRISIVLGVALCGVAIVVQGALPRFETILLSSAIAGLGYTLISGAEEAWIADEIGAERAGRLYLRGAQLGQVGAVFGIVASVALASIQLQIPIILAGCLQISLAGFLALAMPEAGFHRALRSERASWRALGATLGQGVRLVRLRPVLLTIFGITAFWGMASEGVDRLSPDHFLTDFSLPAIGTLDPIYWFGAMGIGGMLLSIAGNEVVRRRVDTASHRAVTRVLFVIYALLVASLLTFALARSFALALAAFWAVGLLRRVSSPLTAAWINQSVDSRVRATIHSLAGQADALGQVVGGPVIGVIGTVRSLRAALAFAGLALTPALLLYARALGQGDGQGRDAGKDAVAPAAATAEGSAALGLLEGERQLGKEVAGE